jgi:ornithine carbamoyltransferase
MHPLATTIAHAPSGRRADGDLAAVLAMAVALEQAARSGGPRPSLAGKKIGLVCENLTSPEALAFLSAATELGAHVAHVRPSLSMQSSAAEISATLRVLGKLYDAVGFQGVPTELLARIGGEAGLPILKNVASVDHPSATLAARLDGRTPPLEARKLVLQAVMLLCLAGD